MKLKGTLLTVAVAAALGVSASAKALTVQGITFSSGANFEFMEIAESEQSGNGNGVIDAIGEKLHGILRITSITDGNGNQTWSNGQDGRELTGYFHDYVATEIVSANGKRYIGFTGGALDIYSDNTPNFERNGSQADDIAKATDSDFAAPWLSLVGSRIMSDAAPLTNPGLLQTLRTEVGRLAFTGVVSGTGLLDIVGGAAAQYLDTDAFGACAIVNGQQVCDTADKTFSSSGQTNLTSRTRPWGLVGTGEIQDVGSALPEPGGVALFGAALASMSLISLRRNKKK